jgi:predicted MFS family arabinose efflux permease
LAIRRSFLKRHYALGLLTLTYVLNFLDRQLLAVLLEPIKAEFQVSDTAMGLLYGLAFALFYATLAIPVARLADQYSRRNILAAAAGVWSLMTVLCGTAGNFIQLVVFRIGVAVGEAGGVPPSQSMVNDIYPPSQRATAMAVFSSGTFIGTILAMVGGAFIAQHLGWRAAFFIVGAPGILLALIIRFTISDPVRGQWDESSANTKTEQTRLWDSIVMMWRRPALRCAMIGCGLACMAGYGIGYWSIAFMMRVHSLSLVQSGLLIGGLGAIIGLLGSLFGGWLCDRLASQKREWLLKLPALSLLLSLPLMLLFLGWDENQKISLGNHAIPVAIVFYCLGGFVGSWWAAPTYVAIQELVEPQQRTLVCAVLLFIMNLIGFGLGPLLVGVFSDMLTPLFQQNAIRYSLMLIMMMYIFAMVFYLMSSRRFNSQRYDASAAIGSIPS